MNCGRRAYDDVVLLELVASSLSLGVLRVVAVESRIENDGRREPSDDLVVVRLLRLVRDVVRLEVLRARDNRESNLLRLVVDQFREPCRRKRNEKSVESLRRAVKTRAHRA